VAGWQETILDFPARLCHLCHETSYGKEWWQSYNILTLAGNYCERGGQHNRPKPDHGGEGAKPPKVSCHSCHPAKGKQGGARCESMVGLRIGYVCSIGLGHAGHANIQTHVTFGKNDRRLCWERALRALCAPSPMEHSAGGLTLVSY